MIRRLTIEHEPAPDDPEAFVNASGESYRIRGDGTGLDQIATFAREVADQTGDPIAYFEVFWPWETEEDQTWDALRVDTTKIDASDPEDWWIATLPPYADLTPAQRIALGIEV